MYKIVFLIPPFSGEGVYERDNIQRRPFDFVSANITLSVLSKNYSTSFFDFDLEGVFDSDEFSKELQACDAFVLYVTDGHLVEIVDKYIESAKCPTIMIGPGSKRFKNKKCFTIIGEPEFEIVKIIDDILIHHKSYKNQQKTILNFNDLDKLPNSDHSNIYRLLERKGYPSVLVSRGCNNSCLFCHSNDFYVPGKKKCRKRSIDNVINEIRQIKNKGISFVHLECESISSTGHEKYTVELIDKLKAENILYSTFCNVAPLANIEFVKSLYFSGCRFLFIGVENYNDYILDFFKKNHTHDIINKSIDNLEKMGIQFGIGFLPFNPLTNINTLKNDMLFLESIISKKYSHPLNICSYINKCVLPQDYSFDMRIANIYMKFEKLYELKVKPYILQMEKKEQIYPERYTSNPTSNGASEIMKSILDICNANQYMSDIFIKKMQDLDMELLCSHKNINIAEDQKYAQCKSSSIIFLNKSANNNEENYIIYHKQKPIGSVIISEDAKQSKRYIRSIKLTDNYQDKNILDYVVNEVTLNITLRE